MDTGAKNLATANFLMVIVSRPALASSLIANILVPSAALTNVGNVKSGCRSRCQDVDMSFKFPATNSKIPNSDLAVLSLVPLFLHVDMLVENCVDRNVVIATRWFQMSNLRIVDMSLPPSLAMWLPIVSNVPMLRINVIINWIALIDVLGIVLVAERPELILLLARASAAVRYPVPTHAALIVILHALLANRTALSPAFMVLADTNATYNAILAWRDVNGTVNT